MDSLCHFSICTVFIYTLRYQNGLGISQESYPGAETLKTGTDKAFALKSVFWQRDGARTRAVKNCARRSLIGLLAPNARAPGSISGQGIQCHSRNED